MLMQDAQIYGIDAVIKALPFEDLWRTQKMDFGYGDQLMPKTTQDKTKEKNIELMKAIQAVAGLSLDNQNVQNPDQQQVPAPA